VEPKQLDDYCAEGEGGSCDGTERFSIVSTADSDADSAPSDRSMDEDETEHASDSESTPLSGLGSDQPPLELDPSPPSHDIEVEGLSKPDQLKSPPRERKLAKMWEACKWGRQTKKEPQPEALPADWMDDEDLDEVTVFEACRGTSSKARALRSPIVVAS